VEVAIEPAGMHLARAEETGGPAPEPREAAPSEAVMAAVDRVLRFAPRRPRELATTPTGLATFRSCPRRYWYRHVLGVDPAGVRGRRRKLAGLLAHGLLETIDFEADVSSAALAALARSRPETLQLGERDVAAVIADLAGAAALVRRELAEGLEIVAREEPVVLALPAAAPEVVLHGRIDVLARRGGQPVVQDYKYAQASSARTADYAAQLDAYRLAVERATGVCAAGEIVFLRGAPRIVALPPIDAETIEAELLAAGRALAAVGGRRDRDAYPRTPPTPAACEEMACAFVRRCWRAAAREVTDSDRNASGRTDAA
jgi:hypothetical protein